MSQANATQLMSKLRYNLQRRRKLKNLKGPEGRHDKIRKIVTALFKHERIELNYNKGDESRGYAERLISDAIRYGENHKRTMEMASYWLLEPQLVHKLFKVLAPRYQNCNLSYTKMWRAPRVYPGPSHISKCVLELRYNVYPPLGPDKTYNKNLIHNVLLNAAKKEFERVKALKVSKTLDEQFKNKGDRESAGEETGTTVKPDDVKSDEEIKVANVEGKMGISETNVTSVEAKDSVTGDICKVNEVKVEEKLNELTINDPSIMNKEIKSEVELNKDLKNEKVKDDKENEKN